MGSVPYSDVMSLGSAEKGHRIEGSVQRKILAKCRGKQNSLEVHQSFNSAKEGEWRLVETGGVGAY